MNGVGLITTLSVPLVADRVGTRRSQLLVSALAAVVGLLGVLLAPEAGVLWSVVLGLSLGAVFPLVLTLPIDVADRPADVGAVAALMLLGGYVLASTAPVVLGAIRDVSGSFVASFGGWSSSPSGWRRRRCCSRRSGSGAASGGRRHRRHDMKAAEPGRAAGVFQPRVSHGAGSQPGWAAN